MLQKMKKGFDMLSLVLFMACGPKEEIPTAPPLGWHQEEGWRHSCYHPPDYASLNDSARMEARETALSEIMSQWNGDRSDGISFNSDTIEEVEITLLGLPKRIEQTSQENLLECKQSAAGGGDWSGWLNAIPSKLNADQCYSTRDTIFDYLNIEQSWERSFPVCPGDKVTIAGEEGHRYKITEDGPWINVNGDQSIPTEGNRDYPCYEEGCFAGMLIVKYTHENGVEEIIPIGQSKQISITIKGNISYSINDDTFYNNEWFKSDGLIDHTPIRIVPE